MAIAGQVVRARAGVLACDAQADPLAAVPPAVWQADDAGSHRVADLNGDGHDAGFRLDLGGVASGEPAGSGVVGMHEQRAADRPLHQASAVVHPGVVASHVTPADQHQAVQSVGARLGEQPVARLAQEVVRGDVDPSVRRGDAGGETPRLERTQIESVRRGAQPGERQAIRPNPQQQVQDAFRMQCSHRPA